MNRTLILAAVLGLCGALNAGANDQISVVEPYVRLAPPNARATGAFMTVRNAGVSKLSIVGAASPVARIVELHNHFNEDGVMKMRRVPSIAIEPGGVALLQPGGLHVMLIDLQGNLEEGSMVPITLSLDDGSAVQFEAPVVRPSSRGGSVPR